MITVFEQTITKMIEHERNWLERLIWRGGWYRITLDPMISWPGNMCDSMETWIKENTKAKVFPSLNHDVYNICFRSKEETMAFILRWL